METHMSEKRLQEIKDHSTGMVTEIEARNVGMAGQVRQLFDDHDELIEEVEQLRGDLEHHKTAIGICSGSCNDTLNKLLYGE